MTFSSLPLSYCTNVHPGRTVQEIIDGLNTYTAELRRTADLPMAAGLWLARSVVSELLADQSSLECLAQTLWQYGLTCYTLNAFPFGDFHTDRVKEQVYLPDWASAERLNYTRDCARILAELLPVGGEGSISTVPLGGRMNPTTADFHATCFRNLIQMAVFLEELEAKTGRRIRLAVEPEPMCHMSSVPRDVLPLFANLFEMADARGHLATVKNYIGLCFDVCHQAVEFENVTRSIEQLVQNDIRINKVHITNAVELRHPASNSAGRAALAEYVEPRYLHQTYARLASGTVLNRLDLSANDLNISPPDDFLNAEAWRIHFHVPVFAETLGPLNTTRTELKAALRAISQLNYAPHLEVETYTWPVMPGSTGNSSLVHQIHQEIESAYALLSELS